MTHNHYFLLPFDTKGGSIRETGNGNTPYFRTHTHFPQLKTTLKNRIFDVLLGLTPPPGWVGRRDGK